MTVRLMAAIYLVFALVTGAWAQQAQVYIQVEARTSLASAQSAVQGFATRFPNANGFALGGGWYGVALGPYPRDEAEEVLRQLRRTGQIPADSYIETADSYRQQFFPIGGRVVAQPTPTSPAVSDTASTEPAAVAQPAPEPAPAAPAEEPKETLREARASERLLLRAEREELQIALKWLGLYTSGIDGAFGPGTRRAMRSWQNQNGVEVTGVLTTRQRAAVLGQYYAPLDGMDMQLVRDDQSGIEIELPLGAVTFDRYEAPFAVFRPKDVPDARVLLISQPGDARKMAGLYEILQTLELFPIDGPRARKRDGFSITGENARIVNQTEVSLRRGEIKGYSLIWPAGDEERRTRVLERMQASFARLQGTLDPAAVVDAGPNVDLVAGLRVRKPIGNATGFFVDQSGAVLTSQASVGACGRITLDGVYEVELAAQDTGLGLALLRPRDALAPQDVAQFATGAPRPLSEISVAGFSFGGRLTAPSVTFGRLEELTGLQGETHIKRLALAALPGDVGGPVFDTGGSVIGVLLPRATSGGRQLPEDVFFSPQVSPVTAFLADSGVQARNGGNRTTIAPEDLTAQAARMTVLVNCWE